MTKPLSNYTHGRDNNFNLIRFIAAFLVLFSHSFVLLSGDKLSEPMSASLGITWGKIAVDVFFITSGFLITASYLNSSSVKRYVVARLCRIYPALIAAVLFSVFIVGLYFTHLSASEYIQSEQTRSYLYKNMTLLTGIRHFLPGVFVDNPISNAINGSLWTLPYEIKFYIFVAVLLALFGFIAKHVPFNVLVLGMAIVLAVLVYLNIFNDGMSESDANSTRLAMMFFDGALCYLVRDKILLDARVFSIMFVAVLLSALNKELFQITYIAFIAYIIFFLAYVPGGFIRKFNRVGDYSYGIYIYAYPIQQSVVALMPDLSISLYILYTFIFTLIMAMFSWHVIEKPALKLVKRFG